MNADIKYNARKVLNGRWRNAVLTGLLLLLADLAASMIVAPFGRSSSASAEWMSLGVGAILTLLLGILYAGGFDIFLSLARGNEFDLKQMIAPFTMQPDRFLIVGLFRLAAAVVCYLPLYLALYFLDAAPQVRLVSLISLLIVGSALYIIFRLVYSQAVFLLLNDAGLGAIQSMRDSRTLMKGRKRQLFVCLLPFLGYGILALCTVGVALLWIVPYFMMTLTEFHLTIMKNHSGMAPKA